MVVVVVAAAFAVPGSGAFALAPLAAAVACSAMWWCATRRPTGRSMAVSSVVVVVGSVAIMAVGTIAGVFLGPVLGALLAASAVTVATLLMVERRTASAAVFGWSAAFVGVVAAVAKLWPILGPPTALLLACWLATTALAARSFGAPPWRGRLLAPTACPNGCSLHRVGLVIAALVVTLLAAVAMVSVASGVRGAAAWLAVAVLESLAAVDLVGIRQWRLAPSARARVTTVAAGAAVAGVAAGGALANGRAWAAAAAVGSAAVLVVAGWRPARCADDAGTAVRDGRPR